MAQITKNKTSYVGHFLVAVVLPAVVALLLGMSGEKAILFTMAFASGYVTSRIAGK